MSDNIKKAIKHMREVIRKGLTNYKNRAIKKGLGFNLTHNYLVELFFQQKGRCYYTGTAFEIRGPGALSLDRVNNNKGYIPGNVVWCRVAVNAMKSSLTYKEVQSLCKEILLHNPNWRMLEKVNA